MIRKHPSLAAVVALLLTASCVCAEGDVASPIGFGFVPPLSFPAENADVAGLRLSLFAGENYNVSFLDIGGFCNFVDGDLMGFELAGLYNQVCTSSGSIQLAGLCNRVEMSFTGIQIAGLVNQVEADFTGIQIGCLNFAEYTDGLQVGVFNRGGDVRGLQIGVFNMARSLVGVQIGLLNFIEDSTVPCLPILNAHF